MKAEHYVAISGLLAKNPQATQRELASDARLSLGLVNAIIKESLAAGYYKQGEPHGMEDSGPANPAVGKKPPHGAAEHGLRTPSQQAKPALTLTASGKAYLDEFRVRNAVILAAGFGARCVPLTYDIPKGLLEVHGQPMIERQIEQLLDKGISEIIIVVGYKKEQFDYLIDRYGVKLVYNPEYATKNNLSSIYRALHCLDSTYLLMSDHWIEKNIFNTYEARSWYSCVFFDGLTDEWCVKASQSDKIKSVAIGGHDSWAIVGPAYLSPSFSKLFRQYVDEYYNKPGSSDFYWEHILMQRLDSLPMYMNRQTGNVHEIENLEELRLFDPSYNNASNNKVLKTISEVFNVPENKIRDIHPIKVGMTNRSFIFSHNSSRYIMRVPGEGSDMLINRQQEHTVYQIVAPLGICDDLVYLDPKEGYKITGFIEGARVCDPHNLDEVRSCMGRLRRFHELKLEVGHTFDLFERIEFYESLWLDDGSCFRDYAATKSNIMKLKQHIDSMDKEWTLSHIDAVPDNFLFVDPGGGGKEEVRIIDWEYAGMQDPHIDIAMFAVYSMYDTKGQVDMLIDCYFDVAGGCGSAVRAKIYAYIAACGLLWSNWCEYKSDMGVEFGEYALRQYRFAKDYYRIFCEENGGKL